MDLEPFQRINPCGYEGLQVTSMAQCLPGQTLSMEQVGNRLTGILAAMLTTQ